MFEFLSSPGTEGSLATGALGGAAAGTAIMPGIGTAIGAGVGLLGAGLTAWGGYQQYQTAQKQAQSQAQVAALEAQQDAVRRRAMEFEASRKNIEYMRTAQRARALALTNSVAQGAQGGSGLQGGYGQIAGQTSWNIFGNQSQLGFGEQMFDLNAQISQQRVLQAQLGGQMATGKGLSAIGGGITSNLGPIRSLAGYADASGHPTAASGTTYTFDPTYGGTTGGVGSTGSGGIGGA